MSKRTVSDTVLVSCSLFVFWRISSTSSSEKQLFFITVLAWSARLWLVVWKFVHCCQISIILFLYPRSIGLLLKYQCSTSWLSSRVHVLCLYLRCVWFLRSSFVYLKKEHSQDDDRFSILAIRSAPADNDTQVCCLSPTLCYI